MMAWQLLGARGRCGTPVGRAGTPVHYRFCPGRQVSLCLSAQKLNLQDLNHRLAEYMQQVQSLEAANQRLERQIEEELDRKCPHQQRALQRHQTMASLLRRQISQCLSSHAEVKLQLLSLKLDAFDLNVRCGEERERRERVEAELKDLRLKEEELKVYTLTHLQGVLTTHTHTLRELHQQHQQDVRGLLSQVPGGVAVEIQGAESSDLRQQLDELRMKSTMLQNDRWSNAQLSLSQQGSMFGSPAGSEVMRTELTELRRTAQSLEEERAQLQAMNILLKKTGLEQKESFSLQLVDLQQRVESLCVDLDSVLQAAVQQAAEYQTLLDIKTRLDTEIHDYKRLLDHLSKRGSSPHSASNTATSQFKVFPLKTVRAQKRNLRMWVTQKASTDHIGPVCQATMVKPLAQMARTDWANGVQSRNLTGLFLMPTEIQRQTEVRGKAEDRQRSPLQMKVQTERLRQDGVKRGETSVSAKTESMTVSSIVNEQICTKEDTKESNLYNTVVVGAQIVQDFDKELVNAASQPVINTSTAIISIEPDKQLSKLPDVLATNHLSPITSTDPDTPNIKEAAIQGSKPETKTKTTTEAGLQANETREISKRVHGTETIQDNVMETKTEVRYGEEMTRCYPGTQIAAEAKKEEQFMRESVLSKESLADQGACLSLTETEKGMSQTSSGVILTSVDSLELQGSGGVEGFLISTKPAECLSPTDSETCLSPVETEEFMNTTEEYVSLRSPDSCLRETYLSPSDSDKCFSPVEALQSPNDEDYEEAYLSLMEANAQTRAVQTYVLSTREENQSLSFSGDQDLAAVDVDVKANHSAREENGLHFGSIQGRNIDPGLTLGSSFQPSRSFGSGVGPQEEVVSLRSQTHVTTLGNKEEQHHFGDLYRKTQVVKGDVMMPEWRYKDISIIVDSEGVLSPVGSPGSRYARHSHGDGEETAINSAGGQLRGLRNRDWMLAKRADMSKKVFGKSTSFESVAASSDGNPGGETSVMDHRRGVDDMATNDWGMANNTAANFDSMATYSTGTVCDNVEAVTSGGASGLIRHSSREWLDYRISPGRISGTASSAEIGETVKTAATQHLATSPPRAGRFGSGEWKVYGGTSGRMSGLERSVSLPNAESEETVNPPVPTHLVNSTSGPGRLGRWGSGEWKVYGGSIVRLSSPGSADGVSVSATDCKISDPPSRHRSASTGSGGRVSSAGRLSNSSGISGTLSSSAGVVRRSSSVGSGGRLSGSAGSQRISSPARFVSTDSGEWKPVYSGASGRRSSAGSGGWSGGAGMSRGTRAPSPGGRYSVSRGSRGRVSGSTASGNRVSSCGSAGSNDRLNNYSGGRISSPAGSARTNSTGGRVISSSDRPIRSTGSGAGTNKERISVCKMAALSIAAAGREKSKEKHRETQSEAQHAAVMDPHIQRWLSSGVGVTGNAPDGLNDIIGR